MRLSRAVHLKVPIYQKIFSLNSHLRNKSDLDLRDGWTSGDIYSREYRFKLVIITDGVYFIPGIMRGPAFKSTSQITFRGHLKHDDVIKWEQFPRYWPFVRGIHRSPVNSPHKGQWRGALMFSLIYAWINGWINNGETGDWRHRRAHYDITVMNVACSQRTVVHSVPVFQLQRKYHTKP